MHNILKSIEDSDAFIESLKKEMDDGFFVPKWNINPQNHCFEIICPISYNDQIFLIHDIRNDQIFSPSTNIEFLKNIIRGLETIK